ncbi:replication initiation factor domain-containing protein [Salinicoccus sp. ID82-1]|uniref:replication initiation factor domain-containing protein n=1 Tax=Salinicoccus sp. ID82-1 TaxID=2820269 RepID=UPI001F218ACD|nr:replication initiation factor domain-containing protein [Salinicoccus sp. ID82-1]MCG1010383.1 replication initiation factor domain-containing protein [Salinicoccus sp. ID82-1]
MAISIINEFVKLAKLETLIGNLRETSYSLPQGYSNGFVCDDKPYYFAIAYHTDFIQMGVCIKFSAHAWMEYRKQYELMYANSFQIHQLFRVINNTALYTSRLSRIDIAIDFINENLNVNTIYNQLSKKNQIVKTAAGRKNHSYLSAITKNNITSTFYLGSKGKNIKALLRVYDKKLEQVETMGIRYEEASQYDSWVRFEAVYKGTYAHNLSNELEKINNDTELKDLLVSALTDRYQFYYEKSQRLTTYTTKMLNLLNQNVFIFNSPSPRMNLLEQSQKHILNGSGLFPYLFKVWSIWGDDGLQRCLTFLYAEFENYEPTDDVRAWLKKYSLIYLKQGQPFK